MVFLILYKEFNFKLKKYDILITFIILIISNNRWIYYESCNKTHSLHENWYYKTDKISIISFSNTVIHIWAVMIENLNTTLTFFTMRCSRRSHNFTGRTVNRIFIFIWWRFLPNLIYLYLYVFIFINNIIILILIFIHLFLL